MKNTLKASRMGNLKSFPEEEITAIATKKVMWKDGGALVVCYILPQNEEPFYDEI